MEEVRRAMGHRKYSAPRSGSLAYLPRGRASRILPRVKYWPPYEGEPKLLGFIGYKAGHTTVFYIDTTPNSPTQGLEVAKVGTVVATPPIVVAGVVGYVEENGVLREVARVWGKDVPEIIRRRIPSWRPNEENSEKLRGMAEELSEVRVVAMAQPKSAGLPRKAPDLLEIRVGGSVPEALEYALSRLGKEVRVGEVFSPGSWVDVIAVSKGKGFEGVVGRYGVKILPRKQRKTRRAVGAIGPWKPPYVMYTVPRAGQLGYHRRTEFNKRILVVGEDGLKYTPKGGFPHFGVVRTECVVVEGTVPGAVKRPIVLRYPARPPTHIEPPEVTDVEV